MALPTSGATAAKLSIAIVRSSSIKAYTSSSGDLGKEVTSPNTNCPSGLIGIGPNHFNNSKLK